MEKRKQTAAYLAVGLFACLVLIGYGFLGANVAQAGNGNSTVCEDLDGLAGISDSDCQLPANADCYLCNPALARCTDVVTDDVIDVADCDGQTNTERNCSICKTSAAPIGGVCSGDSDCATGLKCSTTLKRCVQPPPAQPGAGRLPTGPGPGQACTPGAGNPVCQPTSFHCSANTNKCVQCGPGGDGNCGGSATCSPQGICVKPGGNPAGDFCISGSDCASGLRCQLNRCAYGAPAQPRGGTGSGTGGSGLPGIDLTIDDVFNIITGIACWLLRAAVAIMVIFLVLAAFRFMIAAGDSTKYKTAVTNFKYVLIGIVVIFGVYVIIATVANFVGVTNFSFVPLAC